MLRNIQNRQKSAGGGSCGSDMTMPAAAAGMLMATAAEALSG